ncbi:hypothetical protein [uncultured Paraglaciecola sp.]|uniref:hypothetical protein n=1 Tax=uncultured Paraglaciecola sp. TaxID=1765024 RepID=UPI00261DD93F|nr:hypothetical protein [uncultured Paraglaciecola sp.]
MLTHEAEALLDQYELLILALVKRLGESSVVFSRQDIEAILKHENRYVMMDYRDTDLVLRLASRKQVEAVTERDSSTVQ